MKTRATLLIIFMFAAAMLHAQDIYVRAGLGVAICTTPHLGKQTTYGTTVDSYEVKKMGLGDGLPIVLAAGFNLSENFAIELGIDYFMGFSHKLEDSGTKTSTYKVKGSMLSLVPALVIKVPGDKISPYGRLGLKLGIVNSVKATFDGISLFVMFMMVSVYLSLTAEKKKLPVSE